MTNTYTYSLSSDFGGVLDTLQLKRSINNEPGISQICITVENIGDQVDIVFSGDGLTSGEQTTLDGVVANHDPILLASNYARDDTVTQTNLDEYQTKIEITPYINTETDYKISWYYEYYTDDGNKNIRVMLDGSPLKIDDQRTETVNSAYVYSHCEFTFVSLEEGSHSIQIQFKSETGSVVTLQNCRLHITPSD